jgi:hypothetical protein
LCVSFCGIWEFLFVWILIFPPFCESFFFVIISQRIRFIF